MRLAALWNRFTLATQIQIRLQDVTNARVSPQTIRNRLHERGLRARRPIRRVILNTGHRENCLAWCIGHRQWAVNTQWENVMFSDESGFYLKFTDGRARVWRRRGEMFQDNCIQEIDRYGGGNVMVWAGISWKGKTDLVFIQGNLMSQRYRDEILHIFVWRYAGAVGELFLFQDDNARLHQGRSVQHYLDEQGIERMEWPANSPDLNPIEHL